MFRVLLGSDLYPLIYWLPCCISFSKKTTKSAIHSSTDTSCALKTDSHYVMFKKLLYNVQWTEMGVVSISLMAMGNGFAPFVELQLNQVRLWFRIRFRLGSGLVFGLGCVGISVTGGLGECPTGGPGDSVCACTLSDCHLDLWTFHDHHIDSSHPGLFAPSPGRFAPWTIRHRDGSPPGRFAPIATWMITWLATNNSPNNNRYRVTLEILQTELWVSQHLTRPFCGNYSLNLSKSNNWKFFYGLTRPFWH